MQPEAYAELLESLLGLYNELTNPAARQWLRLRMFQLIAEAQADPDVSLVEYGRVIQPIVERIGDS